MTTQTIEAGQTATISIASPETVSVRSQVGQVSILVTRTGAGTDLITRTGPFVFQAGPYQQSATVEVSCLAGSVTFVAPDSATISSSELASPDNDGLMTAEYAATLEEIRDREGAYVLVPAADAVKLEGIEEGATRNSSDAFLRDLGNATGTLQAANVLLADGVSLQQAILELRQGQSNPASAPTIDTAPSFDDTTPAVGQELTITPGDVTEASGRTSTASYRVNIPGEPEGAFFTSTSYIVPASAYTKGISVTQRQTDSVISTLYTERTSAVTTAVSGTKPTNSVAPSISPNGSQAVGQEHTVSVGTWTGGVTYGVQFYLGGAPSGARSSTLTFTTQANQVGQTLTYDVIAYSALGVASDPVAGSNNVTITGTTPAVVNVTKPAWPSTIYLNSPADFTPGVWEGDIRGTQSATDEGRTWQFFRNSETTPYIAIVNTLSIHTPRSPAVEGDTLYIEETVYDATTGSAYPPVRSLGKTISATPVAFAANLTSAGTAGYSWVYNSAISQSTVATLTGGTAPYNITSTSGLVSGVSVAISGGNVILTGTPTLVLQTTQATINFADSAGTPATASVTFSYSVASASSTALLALPYPPQATALNGGGSVSTIADPGGSGATVYRSRISNSSYPSLKEMRAEQFVKGYSGDTSTFLAGTNDHWWSFGVWMDTTEKYPRLGDSGYSASYDDLLIMQTHTSASGDTQPDVAVFWRGYTNQMYVRAAYNTRTPNNWQYNGGSYPDTEGNPVLWTGTLQAAGEWVEWIFHWRPGYTTAHNPRLRAWYRRKADAWSANPLFDYTGFNTYNNNSTGSYLRYGFYKWSSSNWKSQTHTLYLTPMFYGTGASRLADAQAALENFY